MRKIQIILLIMVSLLFTSCAKRYSATNPESGSIDSGSSTPPSNIEADEDIPETEDPFLNGDWNRPDYGFSFNFDDYVIEASFNNKNQPTYKLVKKSSWISSNTAMNEYYYNGDNITGGGVTMTGVKYYLYKSKNPTYAPDSSYNQSDRLKRFYFYKFTAKTAGVYPTDNYLIAIDTYSKLVFAFGVPISWKSIALIPAPTTWGSVELGWEADANNNKINFAVDGIQYFYEYDPVGIVKSNGEIEIYQWYWDSIGNKRYSPRVKDNVIDLDRPIASATETEGRSPYMPIKVKAGTKDNITIMAKSLKNVSVKSRETLFGIMSSPTNNAWFTYTIARVAYNNEMGSGVLQNIENLDPKSKSMTGMISLSETKEIAVNSQADFTSQIVNEVKNIDKGATIELASRVDKYNKKTVFADKAKFGQYGSGNMAAISAPILKLKYDINNQQFVVDTENSIMNNDGLSTTISYYTPNFTLKRGDTKDITIRYKWMKGNDTKNGEEFEITYTLKFESVNE